MARFIKEHKFQCRWGHIWVDEYATVWRVSAKRYGHEMVCLEGERYAKRDYKTAEDVAQKVAHNLAITPTFKTIKR